MMQIRPEDLQALDGGKKDRGLHGLRLFFVVILNLLIGTTVGCAIGILLKMVLTYAVLGFIMAVLISAIASEGD